MSRKNVDEQLDVLFERLYRPLRLVGGSPKSLHQHRVAIRHFARFLERPPRASDLNDLRVSGLLGYLAERSKAISANKCVDKILAQWRFLAQQGIVAKWPNIRKLPEPEIIPLGWLDDELKRLLNACKRFPGEYSGIPAKKFWPALHHVIYDTAERIGAITELRWEFYDPGSRWLQIPAEIRKGKRKGRIVRLGEDTAKMLKQIGSPKRQLIFPWAKDLSLLWAEYEKVLTLAKLPTDRRSKFHRLRRTVASYYKRAGGDARELLGHSSWAVTEKYLDTRITGTVQASDLLPRIA